MSLVDLLRTRADRQGEDTFSWYLLDGEDDVEVITHASLDRSARTIAERLSREARKGDRVVILMAPGPDFISAFFGCLYAGLVAVPAFLPEMTNIARSIPRLRAISQDAEAACILTDELFVSFREELWAVAPDLARTPWVQVEEALTSGDPDTWRDPGAVASDIAFLQYTSGSTALPKGVVLTHGNLLANSELIRLALGLDDDFVGVSWLPPYHDMGLIGGILQPIYVGRPIVSMSPMDFLGKPYRWLQAMSRYSATVTPAPNFAYELCVRRISDEQRSELDLSNWRVALNGAEPVRASTIDRFVDAFGPCGFRREAMRPCYGLAEATLYVSGSSGEPSVTAFDRVGLADGVALPAAEGAASELLVGCGRPMPEHDIRIVDPQTTEPVGDGVIGEIWLEGPSVGQGYWGRRRQTEEVFRASTADGRGPYLRTGDLGFFHADELYVAGRIKDVLIVRGRNLYPQDLELLAESVDGVRGGCAAAFAVAAEDGSTDGVAIVAEVNESKIGDTAAAVDAIRSLVVEHHQVSPSHVVFIKPRTLPKTSSGKVQRHAVRQRFEEGALETLDVPGVEVS